MNGNIIDDKYKIANELNRFFVNSINDICSSIPLETFDFQFDVQIANEFLLNDINIDSLFTYHKKMNNKTDANNINSAVLIDALPEIGEMIVDVINESFRTGCFPECLKKSTITPVPKVNGTVKMDEFRPINTLDCIEKLFETIMVDQLNEYITANKILCEEQSGFRNQHSCESSINYVIADWKEAQNNSETIFAVFVDLKRAFETVDIDILLKILKGYSFADNVIKFFESFLKNRKQKVKIGDKLSEEIIINNGVPQGSKIGPILFLLYINILKNSLKFCKVKFFADDTLIYYSTKNITVGEALINYDLKNFYSAINKSKLCINKNKTKYLIISHKKTLNKDNIKIKIGDTNIDRVNEIKYLGIIIDDKLNFESNVDYVCKKIGTKICLIGRLKNKLNCQQKIMLYKTLVEPYINYCSSILFLSSENDIERIQKLQNRAMRNILKMNNRTSQNILLDILKFLSVKQRIKYNTMLSIFKIINKLWPEYLSKRIIFNKQNDFKKKLRNCDDIKLNAIKKCSQNSLFYKGCQMFNSLSRSIKEEKNFNKFKKILILYVKEKY